MQISNEICTLKAALSDNYGVIFIAEFKFYILMNSQSHLPPISFYFIEKFKTFFGFATAGWTLSQQVVQTNGCVDVGR